MERAAETRRDDGALIITATDSERGSDGELALTSFGARDGGGEAQRFGGSAALPWRGRGTNWPSSWLHIRIIHLRGTSVNVAWVALRAPWKERLT